MLPRDRGDPTVELGGGYAARESCRNLRQAPVQPREPDDHWSVLSREWNESTVEFQGGHAAQNGRYWRRELPRALGPSCDLDDPIV